MSEPVFVGPASTAPGMEPTALRPFTIGGTGTLTQAAPLPGPLAEAMAGRPQQPLAPALASYLAVLAALTGEESVCAELHLDAGAPMVVAGTPGGAWPQWCTAVADALTAAGIDRPASAFTLRQPGLQVQLAGKELVVTVAAELWDERQLGQFADRWAAAAAAIPAAPTATSEESTPSSGTVGTSYLGTVDDRERLLEIGTGKHRQLPDEPAAALILAAAAAHPDRIAIWHRDREVSYRELASLVRRFRTALADAAVAPGDVVAIRLPRGPEWIAAVIAVLDHRAVYLPLEVGGPAERQRDLIARAGAVLIVDEAFGDKVGGAAALAPTPGRGPVPAPQDRESPAYVYYTSGSTGLPKGAVCSHAGLLNHLYAKVDDCALTENDVVLQATQATFDISLWQFAAPLLTGAHVVVLDHQDLMDVPTMLRILQRRGVTVAQFVPSYLDVLLTHLLAKPDEVQLLSQLRCVSVTGEAISKDLVTRFFRALPGRTLINAYGATEASDDTNHEILTQPPAGPTVMIGRPLGNVTVYVLDAADRLALPGAVGEIAFSGICVGVGYLGDPARTAAAFADDPIRPGERIYRSGDFGRWRADGVLEFHGRRDHQVKISGIRLELGEIEHWMRATDGIRAAAVVTVPSGNTKQLAAFVVTDPGVTIDVPAWRAELSRRLPRGAVPTTITFVDDLPLNNNGKVDRVALAARARQQAADSTGAGGGEPTGAGRSDSVGRPGLAGTAAVLAGAWAQALQIPVSAVTADADFFALGGTSMRALRAVAALDGLIGIDDLLRHPVLANLAAHVDRLAAGGARASAPARAELLHLAGPGSDRAPALVFLPPAAGSAMAAQPLAAPFAEAFPQWDLLAARLPGHDVSVDGATVPLAAAAQALTEALAARSGPVVLWAHCDGAALAVQLRRALPTVRAVVMAAQPERTTPALLRERAVFAVRDDDELAGIVAAQQGIDLRSGALTVEQQRRLGAVYRHDSLQANDYLLDQLEAAADPERADSGFGLIGAADGPADVTGSAAGVRVWEVNADDDPMAATVAGMQPWHAERQLRLADGGHLFPQSRPRETVAVLEQLLPTVDEGAGDSHRLETPDDPEDSDRAVESVDSRGPAGSLNSVAAPARTGGG